MAASRYTVEEQHQAIWVYLEQAGGEFERVSLELLGKGRQLADEAGWPLIGLVFGHEVRHLAQQALAYGADEVWLADHPLLADFAVETYALATFTALMQARPSVFLVGATLNGRDLAGRLAVRLRTGLNADCTDLRLDPRTGILTSEVTGFGGGVLALLEIPNHRPQMATVRPGVFAAADADPRRTGKVHEVPLHLSQDVLRTTRIERVVDREVDLTQASVLVCGGRGVAGNLEMLEELARLMGGEVGATRPLADEGRVGRERQVGQTGVVCRPKLAFACGVSGAFHFVVGIQGAGTVVAINSDAEAPIFDYSDYCIIGDASRIVPEMVRALQERRQTTDA
jgi:electron transfer flavoprotein alpha subunit